MYLKLLKPRVAGSQEEHRGSSKCLGLANLSNDLKTKVGWCHLCSGPGFLGQEPKDLSNQPQAFFLVNWEFL